MVPRWMGVASKAVQGLLYLLMLALPVTAPMVIAADRFAGLLRKSPTVTRVVD